MPAANFKPQFAPLVLAGRKRTTIRGGSRFKVGDRFVGYFGMRTKRCVKLVEGRVTHADPIVIDGRVWVAGRELTEYEERNLAQGDGFGRVVEFFQFFVREYGGRFEGQLVQWEADEEPARVLAERERRLKLAIMGSDPKKVSPGAVKKASTRKRTALRSATIDKPSHGGTSELEDPDDWKGGRR